ncbi:hypothetical protein [Niabella aquatica]
MHPLKGNTENPASRFFVMYLYTMTILKHICLLFLTGGLFTGIHAQSPDQKLESWHHSNPVEKIYLHLDRKDYFAGQTIWFKGYFMSDFLPSARNSTLFIELINPGGHIIAKKVLPVFGGITYGQLDIPDTATTGTYRLRAYTPLMLNHNKDYLYSTPIRIYGRTSKIKETGLNKVSLSFFPEGGTLLAGVENNIAFKATDNRGLPVNISADIKDNTGTVIIQAKSIHDGMGTFQLTPQTGKTYIAEFNNSSTPLPPAVEKGLSIRVTPSTGSLPYTFHTSGESSFTPAYLIGQMQHKIILKEPLGSSTGGNINTSTFPSGVLQLTFFNKEGMPLAERLVLINNKEYKVDASLNRQKINIKARGLNQYIIELNQPVAGNFSVSVTDDLFNEPGLRKENILSSLLLTSDIPGYVHNPAFYFTEDENTKKAADLVMLTNGWRRFNWKEVVQNKLPLPVYNDPGYISLSGKVNVRGSGKSFAERDLLIWVATSDSGRALQMVKTDAEGRFKMDSIVFFDKAKVLFSDIMGNKSRFITVKLDTDSLYQTYNLPALHMPAAVNTNTSLANNMQSAFSSYTKGSGVLLDNIHIEGRRLTLEELEKKYMSGLFAGNINARTINLTGQFIPQMNIFEWLTGRVASLNVQRKGFEDYRLYFRQQPVQLFLDEMPMQDAGFISAIPPNQIALIKIYPQFIGARGNSPAIAVYTKRGDDLNEEMESTGDIVDYDGYSIIKEFYSPDYSTPPDIDYRDNRLTLFWQPEVITDTANASIPVHFYNNDRTKKFKVIAEGITKDGKLLMLEETVE